MVYFRMASPSNWRPSPLQNRVTPWAEIAAISARGMFFGNRGDLAKEEYKLKNPPGYKGKGWILCENDLKCRPLMQPGKYTKLYFLDEATGLAAGHRPCWKCRHKAYDEFVDAWQIGNRESKTQLDELIHADRACGAGSKMTKKTYEARTFDLPFGTIIVDPEDDRRALLITDTDARSWSHHGYGAPEAKPRGNVTVLTPRSIVAALAVGYRPRLHRSSAES